MITANKLRIGYKTTTVVNDLNFKLEEGKFIALIGANGAGKSTLINTMIGIVKPLAGEINWEVETDKKNPFNAVGFSPQSQLIDWYTSVFDNVIQGPLLAGYKMSVAKKQAEFALELLDIVDLKVKPVDHISGGQQQRVQIAREIARKPKIYILDEPTTGLDVETGEKLFRYLQTEVKNGALVLTSSHDLTLLENYADQVLFINEHEQQFFGSLKDFLADGTSLRDKYLQERGN
ncbi:ATP-binding cassette domain-containing protein [Lactobacillus mulieris]|uniref:metal ABC transporter ATP-binding protein n=1 Tax=Lactobacillus mulieris TaxID=2508708 RepID=UPI001432A813|nr:ATP-binding cassette domain-containing protein [Lactobacillus mulieris]MCF1783297.1 ATP-binding cassette domain-containing protein [Lactobacillus mulieris]MCW8104501.1 ATP-binding cassette domain-containing protein [Lactobacillus mulieris]MDK6802942.1 ATP-binding cassette domain-containing protein [Lactobacillus mulieris]MDK8382058.1 ATP-binding cassette domain-containing protein [Lactobacillus mulieris]MDT9620274.1 ATP-binding cassette domain-containing protein [Lactobacillus mulieris]